MGSDDGHDATTSALSPPVREVPNQPPGLELQLAVPDDEDEDALPTELNAAQAPPTVRHVESQPSAAVRGSDPVLASLLDDDFTATDSLTDDLGDEPSDAYIGVTLGDRYVIDRVLGEGGMGKVYRAHHKVIDKKVAIKILHAELAKDKEAVGRFLREARAASSIGNPHIVDITDFGEAADGSTYFVMEFLNGQSLGDTLEELGKIPPKTTVDLAIQLCNGLAAAHAEGIVHRDLKPDNIILVKPKGTWAGQGLFVKILDFGIAKVTGPSGNTSKLTMAGAVFGTPHYMSPEQAAGEGVDQRADIYSLGVMLYEMVSGELPFKAENFMGVLTQHMYKPPPSLRGRADELDCPDALESIILKCMAKRTEARYQSMDELAEDLLAFRQTGVAKASQGTAASYADPLGTVVSNSEGRPALPAPRTSKRLVALAISITTILLSFAITSLWLRSHPTKNAADPAKTAAASVPSAAAAPSASALAPIVPKAVPEPVTHQVILSSGVENAYVMDGDRKVMLPETFKIVEGKPKTLRIEGGVGYEPTEVILDGSKDKVKLDPKKKFGGVPWTNGVGKLPKAHNPDGVVDPW